MALCVSPFLALLQQNLFAVGAFKNHSRTSEEYFGGWNFLLPLNFAV
jgi:hypothetical protein